eukprot:7983730-Alexandrium_andersonii.AAC.1
MRSNALISLSVSGPGAELRGWRVRLRSLGLDGGRVGWRGASPNRTAGEVMTDGAHVAGPL